MNPLNALAKGFGDVVTPGTPANNALSKGVGAFARGFIGPEGVQQIQDRRHELKQREQADATDKNKKGLAMLQQLRNMPADKRMALVPRISQATGQQLDPANLSDEGLDSEIAMLMGQLGQGPAPKYTGLTNLGDGGVGALDAQGNFKTLREPTPDPARAAQPQKPDIKEGANGNYWERNAATGVWKDTGVKSPPPSSGVTINMPGSVREGVDPTTGRPAFVGINPGDDKFSVIEGAVPPTQMMGAETKAKFLAMAPNAYAGISQLEKLFSKGGDDPLSGLDDVAAQVFSGIPGVGEPIARGLGGQNWQDFDQAWNAIELGVHIPAGAAVSPSEALRFLRANKPALNETGETKLRKLQNVKRFYDGLQAGFNGDWTALQSILQSPSQPAQPSAPAPSAALPPDLDAEELQAIEQMRAAGMPEEQIMAIINGQ